MKAVKFIFAATVAALVSSAAFAEGWSVSGNYRGTAEGVFQKTIIDSTNDSSETNQFQTYGYNGGYNLGSYAGFGANRLRFNLKYDGELAGFTFRYDASSLWFVSDNIKFAQAYLNLVDGLVTLEGGILVDNHTGTDGDIGYAIADGKTGVRLNISPIEGLDVNAVIAGKSTSAGDPIYGFAAKYTNNAFSVVAGYTPSEKEIYAGASLTAFEPVSAIGEVVINHDTGALTFGETVNVTLGSLGFGFIASEARTSSDADFTFAFYPYVSYDLSGIVTEGLSTGLDVAYEYNGENNYTVKVTPEVTYKVGAGAIQLYYSFITSRADTTAHTETNVIGLAYKVNF